MAILLLSAPSAFGASIAIIGNTLNSQNWCAFLISNGHECVNLPDSGPTEPLSPYDLVILLANWDDPDGLLGEHVSMGKSVITLGAGPLRLGINTDPTVQAWIGANAYVTDNDELRTVIMDPILGFLQPGTMLAACADSTCASLADTTGHPNAKVLARLGNGTGSIGIMRNRWEGGQSVYFMNHIGPHNPFYHAIILNTVRELSPPPIIPTVSAWGVAAMTLLLLAAGSVIVRRKLSVISFQ